MRTAIAATSVAGLVLVGAASALGAVTGSGATFPRIAYENWCRDSGLCSYTAKGSSGGITDLTNGVVDFAGSDATLTDQQAQALQSRRGTGIYYFPTLLGAITVPTNVSGVNSRLKLDGKTVGGIFAGDITTWNDKAIAATNKGVKLPNASITVCVRSDGSGTSFGFSRYLTKVSPSFKSKVNFGQTPPWTAPNVVKQPGNPGVANCVKSNDNSIGYVDLGDAINAGLTPKLAAIGKSQTKKANGKNQRTTVYVLPSVKSIQAAGGIKTLKPDLTIDFSASPAKGAYPIVVTTWILGFNNYGTAGKAGALQGVRELLNYVYSKNAQNKLAALGFAPLPDNIVKAAKLQVARLK
jgi:phosphate transport system substrate-binding protein